MTHPRVIEFDGDIDGPLWRPDENGAHQVVPLGGVHIYRDENGEWPSDADPDSVREAAAATGLSVETAQFVIGEWLDALEAAKGETPQ